MRGTSGTGLMILSTTRDSIVVALSDDAFEKNNFQIARNHKLHVKIIFETNLHDGERSG